ncbi:lipoxygenase homology domain-containing protein 1-like isoform X2 [Xenia sp. Carnegie-2017]|nr:lipoxygenase homology domain-containing protein 1-like isoform X2 [Xenia sp. Carnegie-2017]XP_046860543.1 lipoxygenase homology domain-containing protein 1-like isoform X2 [Xenia sp. Carnegie-2017]
MSTFDTRTYSQEYTQHSRSARTTTSQYTYRTVNGENIDHDEVPYGNVDRREEVQRYTYTTQNGYGDGRYGYPGPEYRSGAHYPPNARNSPSPQGSSEGLQRQTNSYEESFPPPVDERPGSASGLSRGVDYPYQSQTLPRSFGQNDTEEIPQGGSSTLPRQSQKQRENITYNLSMKVGDVRGSGADGNVYIQLFGTEGKTAKIQLRQAGDTRNKFEKGKTYKFTVDTVDIGQLERIKLSHDHRGYGSGFFVDEVEVEVPSKNDRVTFPCNCWLAQDLDGGANERDMVATQPSKPSLPSKVYTVSVRVGEVINSQTTLYIQLFGENADTSKIMLRPAGPSLSKFEPGRTYKFIVETVDIGKVMRLRMGQDSKTGGRGLYVETIEIDPEGGESVLFPCQAWSDEDDHTQQDIFPEPQVDQKDNVDYHLIIRTGDIKDAGTNAPVFIQLIGDEGETERIELSPGGTGDNRFGEGRTDKFVIGTIDVGKPERIRIGHLGRDPDSNWYLDEVIVDIPTRNEHYVYPHHAWLAADRGDGRTETELYGEIYKVPLGAGAPPLSQSTVAPKQSYGEQDVGDDEPSYADEEFPDPPDMKDNDLVDGPEAAVEEVIQQTDMGKLEASTDYGMPSSPPRSLSPDKAPNLKEGTSDKSSVSDEAEGKAATVTYELCLKMGDVQGTGTEGSVFVELIGSIGNTERIILRESDDSRIKFAKGKSYKFTIETADIGLVERVCVGHDARGPGVGWYLDEISVYVPSRDEEIVFSCHCWLAEDKDDGRLERELSSTLATYHLALATGDVDNGGTEAVPYVQIFGERGDTGIIELRKEASSGFVRGKTDFFNVDAVDIGAIQKIRVGHNGQGYESGWFLEEVVLDCPQHGEHLIFPAHIWLSDVESDQKTEREFYPEPVATYKVFIRTGNRLNSGTDASVYMQIFGDLGDTGIIDLKQVMTSTRGQFSAGNECKFEMDTVDVGMLEKVRIGHDNSGRDPSWYLDEVMIILREECWVLPCHDWLDEVRECDTERILFPEMKTFAEEPELEDLIEYLRSDDVVLIVNAEAYLQHLFFKDEETKNKFRALKGIPPLVRLLDSRNEDIHKGAAGTLRNLSFSKQSDESKIEICRYDGMKAMMRLLQRTERVEVKDLLLSIIWNLSSCEALKRQILDECLVFIVTSYVIPDSGWDKRDIEPVRWTFSFRNATGVLRNLSSAGVEARTRLRDVYGLIDSLLYVIRLSLGKSGIDPKTVENCVCILRNLSYRLEEEVDRNKYHDTDVDPDRPDRSIYGGPEKSSSSFFSRKSKKKGQGDQSTIDRHARNIKEGVALLWQPEVLSPLLVLLAESTIAETLEAAVGMIHNLTACSWRWSALLRSTLRREKGLPILVELLRVNDDGVIRADATALRNLALDARNKVVIGKYAMKDLVYRLPSGEGSQGITEPTYGAIICTIHQLVDQDSQNAKAVRDVGGVVKLVKIAKGNFDPKVVKTANQVLISMWNFKETRSVIDKQGWQFTKTVSDEYGQSPRPRAFDDVTLPRSGYKSYDRQVSQPFFLSQPADETRDLERRGYAVPNGNTSRSSPSIEREPSPVPPQEPQPEAANLDGSPLYAKVNKNRRPEGDGEGVNDSWV